jgi:hypothetical protein
VISSVIIYLLRLPVFVSELNSMPHFSLIRNAKEVWAFELGRDQEDRRSKPMYVHYHCSIRLAVPWNITSDHYCNNEAPAKSQVKCHYGPHKSDPALLCHFCITYHCYPTHYSLGLLNSCFSIGCTRTTGGTVQGRSSVVGTRHCWGIIMFLIIQFQIC